MSICGEPGIYNDCADVGVEDFVICTLPPGHRGLHRDGGRGWGRLGDLSEAEKLDALGLPRDREAS